MHPVLPFTAQKVWELLNLNGKVEEQSWYDAAKTEMREGHLTNKPKILFTKIEDEVIEKEIKKLENAGEEKSQTEYISFEEFQKIDLRVATIKEAEKVKKTDKLLKLKIEVANTTKTIVAGVAEYYKPENLIGKQIVVVNNLQPTTIRGIESQGMLLAARENDQLTLLTTDNIIKSGSKIS
jgi:methionyl-tRNA synthetase